MSKFISLIILLLPIFLFGQIYVGQLYIHNESVYAKIEFKTDTILFSMPYLEGDLKYTVIVEPSENRQWVVQRQNEELLFETRVEDNVLTGQLTYLGQNQAFHFRKQLSSVGQKEIQNYLGTFTDKNNRRAVVYERYGYLHLMSPYSQETMSLKPVGENVFWSVSGELSRFTKLENQQFQKLVITDQFGIKHELSRAGGTIIESFWIPVNADTLFAKLFIPPGAKNNSACLILPGGGAVGMENYEYEARFFAAHGIVSLIFDKSGNGNSKGTGNFNRQSFEEKNDQYKAVFRYLQALPYVDKTKIGIHGPSEGGRLALMMAIDLKDSVAFVNSVAAPLVSMFETQLYAFDSYHRNLEFVSEVDLLAIKNVWHLYFSGIIKGEIDPKIVEEINRLNAVYNRLFLPPSSTSLPATPTREDLLNNRILEQGSAITCPIYFQYGEMDERVNQEHNLVHIRDIFKHHPNVQTKVYHRGNHSFMTPEYKICTGYANDKIAWLKSIGIVD